MDSMIGIMKLMDGPETDLGIEDQFESRVYFRLKDVKGLFRFKDQMMVNVYGVDYALNYDKDMFKEMKDYLNN